jgi:hypothetical protein
VIKNIQDAFDEHRKKIRELKGKKWRFAGVELGSCIAKGAIQIASACGVPGVSLLGTAIDQSIDVPKLKDLPKKYRALKEEHGKSTVQLSGSFSMRAGTVRCVPWPERSARSSKYLTTATENDCASSSDMGEGGQWTASGLEGQMHLRSSRADGAVRQSQPRGISGKWQLIAKA